jgi:hypothetical protein
MTDDQREALTSMQRKMDELNALHPVTVGLPPEIAGNAPKTYQPSRRCGKCGGVVRTANSGERECTCEQVVCVLADGTVVYLTRGELNLIISARPVEVPGTDPGCLDAGRPTLVPDLATGLRITKSPPAVKVSSEDVRAALTASPELPSGRAPSITEHEKA